MDHHINVRLAVEHFLVNQAALHDLPLISDVEIRNLFGPETASALDELDKYNQRRQLCRHCKSRCCRLIHCEIYSEKLKFCPLGNYRPLLCRMHYCSGFREDYPLLVKEIGDIYLDSLIAGGSRGMLNVDLFDCPPLLKVAPDLVSMVSALIREFMEDRCAEEKVCSKVTELVRKPPRSPGKTA